MAFCLRIGKQSAAALPFAHLAAAVPLSPSLRFVNTDQTIRHVLSQTAAWQSLTCCTILRCDFAGSPLMCWPPAVMSHEAAVISMRQSNIQHLRLSLFPPQAVRQIQGSICLDSLARFIKSIEPNGADNIKQWGMRDLENFFQVRLQVPGRLPARSCLNLRLTSVHFKSRCIPLLCWISR